VIQLFRFGEALDKYEGILVFRYFASSEFVFGIIKTNSRVVIRFFNFLALAEANYRCFRKIHFLLLLKSLI